jgi:carboxyl-terminal processing protease
LIVPGFRILRGSVLLALSCLGLACYADLVGSDPPAEYAAMFDLLWRDFDRHYALFDLKQIDWNGLRTVYEPQATQARTDGEFAQALAGLLAELRDGHVALNTPTATYVSPNDAPTTFSADVVFSQYVTSSTVTPSGRIRFGMLATGAGYVRISLFFGWPAEELDAVLEELAGVPAMLLDVRGNGGGNRDLAAAGVGRFSDISGVYAYERYRNGPGHGDFTDHLPLRAGSTTRSGFAGRVAVLTDTHVASSAEDFVLAMREVAGATIVGDTTAGSLGNPLTRELPNGWTYHVSRAITYSLHRSPLEDVGIAPDVFVPGLPVDSADGTDPMLERAIALLEEPAVSDSSRGGTG